MARCITPKPVGLSLCNGEIHHRENSDTHLCATCRRIFTEDDIIWIEKVNLQQEIREAEREQERKAKNEQKKTPGKRRVFS
jgi:hypothetical protein